MDELIEMGWIVGCFFRTHLLFHFSLAIQNRRRLTKGLKELFADAPLEVDIEFLLEIGDAGRALANHLSAAGFFKASDEPHLRGFAGSIHTNEANAIARLDLPGHIAQHFAGGINLADLLESQQRSGA
jgi:hypothetical protein